MPCASVTINTLVCGHGAVVIAVIAPPLAVLRFQRGHAQGRKQRIFRRVHHIARQGRGVADQQRIAPCIPYQILRSGAIQSVFVRQAKLMPPFVDQSPIRRGRPFCHIRRPSEQPCAVITRILWRKRARRQRSHPGLSRILYHDNFAAGDPNARPAARIERRRACLKQLIHLVHMPLRPILKRAGSDMVYQMIEAVVSLRVHAPQQQPRIRRHFPAVVGLRGLQDFMRGVGHKTQSVRPGLPRPFAGFCSFLRGHQRALMRSLLDRLIVQQPLELPRAQFGLALIDNMRGKRHFFPGLRLPLDIGGFAERNRLPRLRVQQNGQIQQVGNVVPDGIRGIQRRAFDICHVNVRFRRVFSPCFRRETRQ